MATITSNINNCTEATTAKAATLTNNNLNYSIQGEPGTTVHIFSKTFTAIAGHRFVTPPSVSFANTTLANNYSFIKTETGSVSSGNLTVRKFDVYYKIPNQIVSGDSISFFAEAEFIPVTRVGKITGYQIDEGYVNSFGEVRNLTIFGDPGATVSVEAKITGGASIVERTLAVSDVVSNTVTNMTSEDINVYKGMSVTGTNVGSGRQVVSLVGKTLTTTAMQGTVSGNLVVGGTGSFTVTIGQNGSFVIPLTFPSTTSNRTFTVTLNRIASNSWVDSLASLSTKAITLKQFKAITVTLTLVNASSNSGHWDITKTTPVITNVGQADSTNFAADSIPVSWVVYAAQAGEIQKTASGFAISSFTNNGGSAAGGQITIGSNALTNTTLSLENATVTIDNVGVYSNVITANTSGTKELIISSQNPNLYIGMSVTGTGIQSATTITGIVSSQNITISKTTTQDATLVTFSGKPKATISGSVRVIDRGQVDASSNIEINNILTLQS